MKDYRIIALLSVLFTCTLVQAQQLPVYDLYIKEKNLYNPAFAGMDKDVKLSLNFKKSDNRIAGSPVTGWAGWDMGIRSTNIGIGSAFFIDNVGPKSTIGGNVSYSYHIPFSKEYDHRLSIGMTAGFIHQRFNTTQLVANQPNDPGVVNLNNNSGTAFDMNVGINYRWKGLNVGFSVPQVIESELKFRQGGNVDQTNATNSLRRHYFVLAGYEAAMGKEKNFFLEPSFAVRKIKGLPVQFDANLMFDWDRQVWVGASYKSANKFKEVGSFATIAGFNIKKRMDITYSFGLDFDETVRTDFGYGHEVLLTVKFGKRFKEIEARLDTAEEAIKRNALAIAENSDRIDSLEEDMNDMKDQVNSNTERLDQHDQDIADINENITNIFNTVEEMMSKSNVMYKKIGSVYFDNDSYKLTDEAKSRLDAMKDALQTPEGEFFIYLAGNASAPASNDYNMLLSTKRSAAVKEYLEGIGVGGHIFLLSYGEEAPVVDPQRTEEQRAQNRRVDIFISGK